MKVAFLFEGLTALAKQAKRLRALRVFEQRQPMSQFIYTVPKCTVPKGKLREIVVGGVPGLFCVFVCRDRIAAIETISREVLVRYRGRQSSQEANPNNGERR